MRWYILHSYARNSMWQRQRAQTRANRSATLDVRVFTVEDVREDIRRTNAIALKGIPTYKRGYFCQYVQCSLYVKLLQKMIFQAMKRL